MPKETLSQFTAKLCEEARCAEIEGRRISDYMLTPPHAWRCKRCGLWNDDLDERCEDCGERK